jgi:voltage-gated potassium channel
LLALAVGSLPLLLLEFKRDRLTSSDLVVLDVVNIVVLVAFAIDYVVELSLARDRWAYVRGEWVNGLVVVTSAVAVVPRFALFGGARVIRGLPALRGLTALVRVVALGGAAAREGRRLIRRRALTFAICVAGMTWLTAAAAFTLAENVGEGGRVESFGDALWWSATTITTVGYGDVVPVTGVGRTIGLVAMVVGISTFAVVTARAAAFLVTDDDASVTDHIASEPVRLDVATVTHLTAGYAYLSLREHDTGSIAADDWAPAFDPGRAIERDRYVLSRPGVSARTGPRADGTTPTGHPVRSNARDRRPPQVALRGVLAVRAMKG